MIPGGIERPVEWNTFYHSIYNISNNFGLGRCISIDLVHKNAKYFALKLYSLEESAVLVSNSLYQSQLLKTDLLKSLLLYPLK